MFKFLTLAKIHCFSLLFVLTFGAIHQTSVVAQGLEHKFIAKWKPNIKETEKVFDELVRKKEITAKSRANMLRQLKMIQFVFLQNGRLQWIIGGEVARSGKWKTKKLEEKKQTILITTVFDDRPDIEDQIKVIFASDKRITLIPTGEHKLICDKVEVKKK